MLACEAAGEQDPESVVGEVAEPAAGALDLLDQEVRGFDGTVAHAGRVMVQDLNAPPSGGLASRRSSGPASGAVHQTIASPSAASATAGSSVR